MGQNVQTFKIYRKIYMVIKTRSAEKHSKPQTSMMTTLILQQKTKQKTAAQFVRQGGGGVILFTFKDHTLRVEYQPLLL